MATHTGTKHRHTNSHTLIRGMKSWKNRKGMRKLYFACLIRYFVSRTKTQRQQLINHFNFNFSKLYLNVNA